MHYSAAGVHQYSYVLISHNLLVSQTYFDSNTVWNENVSRYCDFYLRISLKWTLTEAHLYMQRHQGAKCKHLDVSEIIYHNCSHGPAFYMLNGENVNVMLEYMANSEDSNQSPNLESPTISFLPL